MKHGKRRLVSLLTAASFAVLAISGIAIFFLPFSLRLAGLHALMGIVFIGLIALHATNNATALGRYHRSRVVFGTTAIVLTLTVLFLWQPEPIRSIFRLSQNLGPELDRFGMTETDLRYDYSPTPQYKLALSVKVGPAFDLTNPPRLAIWLENASFYHIKTLYQSPGLEHRAADPSTLPYWDYKVRGWEAAKRRAAQSRGPKNREALQQEIDADGISAATQNSSFDPADYILPPKSAVPMPYRLLIEIDQPDDQQPSLVYSVEINNADPRTYQLLELVGFPQREEVDEANQDEQWSLFYIDQRFGSALDLVDSALLTIQRDFPKQK